MRGGVKDEKRGEVRNELRSENTVRCTETVKREDDHKVRGRAMRNVRQKLSSEDCWKVQDLRVGVSEYWRA